MSNNNVGNADPRYEGDSAIASMTTNLGSGHSTAENPGDVHPTSDPNSGLHKPKEQGPSIFHSIENPYALREALNKLESSLDEIISMFESEGNTLAKDGSFSTGKEGIRKFKAWREEVESIKRGEL